MERDSRIPLSGRSEVQLHFRSGHWVVIGEAEWGPLPAKPTAELTSDSVNQWEGGSPVGATAEQFLTYRLPSGNWGVIQVLYLHTEWVRIHHWSLAGEQSWWPASAIGLQGAGEPEGNRLTWSQKNETAYAVSRWTVGANGTAVVLGKSDDGSFLDESPPAGVMLEYLVTPLDDRIQEASRIRLLRQIHPGDWPLGLQTGMGLNVLTGATDEVSRHLVVHQVNARQVMLRPSDDCALSVRGKEKGVNAWRAPKYEPRAYQSRMRSMEFGESAFFFVESQGLYGRLTVESDGAGGAVLYRSIDWTGDRWLPTPPTLQEMDWEGDELALYFRVPLDQAGHENASRVVEIERKPGSGDWVEWSSIAGAEVRMALQLAPEREDLPLVHLRFRHRFGQWNRSIASEPVPALILDQRDTESVERVKSAAIQALGNDRFEERYLGEQVLRGLGQHVWPDLLEMYEFADDSRADLARQILLSPEGIESGQLEPVMRISGAREGLAGPLPTHWFHPDPEWRVYQLLIDAGRVEWKSWLEIVEKYDPELVVRETAALLLSCPEPPGLMAGRGRKGVLTSIRPGDRIQSEWPNWQWELDGAEPEDVAEVIRSAVMPGRLLEAQALLALAREALVAATDLADREALPPVLLGLGLVDMHRGGGGSILLEAVRDGVVSVGATVAAWRDLSEWRLDGAPDPEPESRKQVRLPEASLEQLQQTLADLEVAKESYIDIILPPGLYAAREGMEHWVDLRVEGVALLGEPGVQLDTGVRITGVQDVILADLGLHHKGGVSLAMVASSATLRNVTLTGDQSPVSLQESTLEMDRCRLESSPERDSVIGVRMMGKSLLLARASRLHAGGLVLSDEAHVILDHCTLDGGRRPIFQGQKGGRLLLRDCVLLDGLIGFQGLGHVRLEGVLSTLRSDTVGSQNAVVHVCPDHVRAWQPVEDWKGVRVGQRCPLLSDR